VDLERERIESQWCRYVEDTEHMHSKRLSVYSILVRQRNVVIHRKTPIHWLSSWNRNSNFQINTAIWLGDTIC